MRKDLPIEILRVIDSFSKEHGYPPSIRDVKEATDYSSTSGIYIQMENLANAGFLVRELGIARSVRLTKEGRKLLDAEN